MRRLEIWSTWQANGGTRQYVVPNADMALVIASRDLLSTDQLQIQVPVNSVSATKLVKNAVIRVDQDDAPTFDEYKIIDAADDETGGLKNVTAVPLLTSDFANCALLSQTNPDGTRDHDYTVLGLTPAQHLAIAILPTLSGAGLGFITAGTISPVGRFDLTLSWDNPLSALKRIADQTGCEIDLRRTGASGYVIDLIPQIGSSAAVSDLRAEKNLDRLKRTDSATNQITRIYPKGAKNGDYYATIAEAAWQVTNITTSGGSTFVTLADPAAGEGPIAFDGQLVGITFRTPSGVNYAVTGSSAANQTVTLTGTSLAIAIGDVINFRSDSSNTEMTWLDSPADQFASGLKVGTVELSDTPGHRNYVKNAALRSWPGTYPDNWSAAGGPTTAVGNTHPYYITGQWSIQMTCTHDGDGIVSDAVPIFPTTFNRWISGYAQVWTVTGAIRVELLFTTPGGIVAKPLTPQVATNAMFGQFESLGVSGIDALLMGATAVAIRIVQNGPGSAVFYLDSAQLTLSTSQLPFVEGSGGTKLWQGGNDRLREYGAGTLSLEATIADLATIDARYVADSTFVVGGMTRVTNSRLGIATTVRLTSIQRNYLIPAQSKVTLSNKPGEFTGRQARPKRPTMIAGTFDDPNALPIVTGGIGALDNSGAAVISIAGSDQAQSFKAALSTSATPSDATVEATSAINGNAVTIAPGTPTVSPGQTLYAKIFAYSLANGGGLRSAAFTFSLPYAMLRRGGFSDGYGAVVSNDPTGVVVNASVADASGSSARAINLLFAKPTSGTPDDLSGVPNGSGYNKSTSTYVDSSGRTVTVFGTTRGTALTGDTLGSNLGVVPGNLVINGGGQDGPIGVAGGPMATGWSYGAGPSYLFSTAITAQVGDRCLSLDLGTGGGRTYSFQRVALKAGKAYQISGWVRAYTTQSTASDGVYLELDADVGSFTFLDNNGPSFLHINSTGYPLVATQIQLGVQFTGADTGFRFVQATFIPTADCAPYLYCVVGTGGVGTYTGQAYFDAITIQEIPPNVAAGGIKGYANLTDTGVAPQADIGGVLPASQMARQAGGYFMEVFNSLPDANSYTDEGSVNTRSLVANATGMAQGRNVYHCLCSGGVDYRVSKQWLPYNPNKLYRIRARFRTTVNPSTTQDIYIGVRCIRSDGSAANSNSGNAYVCVQGEVMSTTATGHDANGWVERVGWFKGATLPYASGSPGLSTDPTAPTALSLATTMIAPLWLLKYPGGNGTFELDYILIDEFDELAQALTYNNFSGIGSIAGGVTQGDAAGGRVMLRGRQTGACRNGDAVTFSPPFQNIPIVDLSGGAYDEPRSKWGATGDGTEGGAVQTLPQYPDFGAVGLTSSGFTARGRLRQKAATTTAEIDYFTGASLSTIGDTCAALGLSAAPGNGDVYTVDLYASLTLNHNTDYTGTESISFVAAIDVDVTGTGAWSELANFTFTKSGTSSGSQTFSQPVALSILGVTSSSLFRVRLKDRVDVSAGSTGYIEGVAVEYDHVTGGGDQYASKTPDTNDRITWTAYEASLT